MPALGGYLPEGPGLLPKWMLIVSGLAVFNTVQTYATLNLTRRLYSGNANSVTGLQSRCFGLWTLMSALVRYNAAYNIHDKQWYNLAIASYIIVLAHYVSEFSVYRTTRLNAAFVSPMLVGGASLVWMLTQYSYYVKV